MRPTAPDQQGSTLAAQPTPARRCAAGSPALAARSPAARGFTLLEVLVALVVVALGMSALLETLTQSAQNVAALRDRTVAEWIAMNQVALARLSLNAPTIGITQGDVQNCANGQWHWQQSVSAVDAVPGLMSITVRVRRTGNATNTSSAAPPVSSSSAAGSNAPGASHLGATGQLGPNITLGPTAALGSVTSLNTVGCASLVTAGSSLGPGAAGSPGQLGGSIGASGTSLGAASGLGGPSPGNSLDSSAADPANSPAGALAALGAGGSSGSSSSSNGNAGAGSSSSSSSSGTGHWLVTLTGFRGNTLGAASGESPDWAGSTFAGETGPNGIPNGGAGSTGPGSPGSGSNSPAGSPASQNSSGGLTSPPLLLGPP